MQNVTPYDPRARTKGSDGAYWAWSVKRRDWILVHVVGQRGTIDGVESGLLELHEIYNFTSWVGPLQKPEKPG